MQILMAKAIEWAEQQASVIAANGKPLAGDELMMVHKAGVVRPELIRIMPVAIVPLPDDPLLRQWAKQLGVFGHGAIGLTIGYGIYIREGCRSLQVLSHEFRHVYQFEQAGSVAVGVQRYLEQLIEFGYHNAPLELDARSHEMHI